MYRHPYGFTWLLIANNEHIRCIRFMKNQLNYVVLGPGGGGGGYSEYILVGECPGTPKMGV